MQNQRLTRWLARKIAVRRVTPGGRAALLACVLGYSLSWPATAADLSMRAFVDRSRISEGQRFTLSVELSGSDADDAPNPEAPELDFARFLGSGTSTSMQIINARITSSRTLNFYYAAERAGDFTIPPITVRSGGSDYTTDPISIEVARAEPGVPQAPDGSVEASLSGRDLFLTTDVSRRRVYSGEPVILTHRIFTRVTVSKYGISKQPDRSGFWVEDLLEPNRQVETSTEVLNGQRYTVAVIQRSALFPTSPGKKILSPLEVECEVRVRRARRSLFDDFFEDPFGQTAAYSIRSETVEIEVLPLPTEGRPPDFSGAVGSYSLTGEASPDSVNVNDVVTLRLTLEGSGNIRTLSNPTVSVSPGLEIYDPDVSEAIRPAGDKIQGRRTFEYVLVPRSAGTHRIEPIRLVYFDPADATYKSTGLDATVIRANPLAAGDTAGESSAGQSKQDVRLLAQEIRFIKLNAGSFRKAGFAFYQSPWFWGVLALPPLMLAGTILFRARADRLRGDVAYARDRRAAAVARRRLAEARLLLQAEKPREFYAESGRALRGLAADKLNLPEAGLISEDLSQCLLKAGVRAGVVEEFLGCLQESDLRHFAPVESTKDEMAGFLRKAEQVIATVHKELSR